MRDGNGGSLADRVYRHVKDRILRCDWSPGEVLVAQTVAEELSVSRTPVHEGLKALAQEGMLRVVPRVGYVVAHISMKDVQEIFQLRRTLEALAAGLAAKNATLAELEQLSRRSDVDEHLTRVDGRRPSRLAVEANRAFHVDVARIAGNRRLEQAIGRLLDESQRVLTMTPLLHDAVNDQHDEIVDAISRREPAQATAAMARHIEVAQAMIADHLLPRTEIGVRWMSR